MSSVRPGQPDFGLVHPDIDDVLERQRKPVCSAFMECGGFKAGECLAGLALGGNTTGRRCPDSLRGRTQAEFVQDTNDAFEATIYGHYFVNPGRCGGEIGEMRKRVEEW